MIYYGIFGSNIQRSKIPFDWETLEDGEQIINYDKSYVLVTADPREFLSESRLYQTWKKRE
jgi:hypothetical protein